MTTSSFRPVRTLRVLGGLAVGYVTIVALSTGTTAILRTTAAVARSPDPPAWYLTIDLGYSVLFALVGGFVATAAARGRLAGSLLAASLLALGILSAATGMDPLHPPVYEWTAAFAVPLSIVAGTWWASERARKRARRRTR